LFAAYCVCFGFADLFCWQKKSRPSLDALAPQPDAEPPRPSLIVQAKQYVADLLHILKNKEFILVALSAGISAGVYVGWSGLLSAIMMPNGYTQDQVSWIGMTSPLAAMVGGVAIGKIAGMLRNKHRGLSLSLYAVTIASFGLFMLSVR
jgi:cyanate permease